jgi:hypothetical protein
MENHAFGEITGNLQVPLINRLASRAETTTHDPVAGSGGKA